MEPPPRMIHAVEVGVHVAMADLQDRYAGPEACRSAPVRPHVPKVLTSGLEVAQEELERLHEDEMGDGGPRPRALLDREALAVQVAIRRGVLTGLGLTGEEEEHAPGSGEENTTWAEAQVQAMDVALACVRSQCAPRETRSALPGRPRQALDLDDLSDHGEGGGGRALDLDDLSD